MSTARYESDQDGEQVIPTAYGQQASGYDKFVKLFNLFAWMGFDLEGWRKQASSKLGLKPGDTVVDIGCGTGLNFPALHQAVSPQGRIIGVDLSENMLAQARRTVEANHWTNIELVCADASQYEFPSKVNAVLSTFALILVPDPGRLVSRAREALCEDGRLVVLDMAWPRFIPLWFRHVLFFLRSYGVTKDTLLQRPWLDVQKAMQAFDKTTQKNYWFGFFYLVSGARQQDQHH